ncbi:ScpA/B protein [Leptospira ryugenii]|uniref:ScpA/B protein n=1 Tax=Leptospira ryugenii TaxID=1917863 RepID=A0A2P2E5K2_9LEPT|nr:ScpA/B protein [Leptospira ryugenii]
MCAGYPRINSTKNLSPMSEEIEAIRCPDIYATKSEVADMNQGYVFNIPSN